MTTRLLPCTSGRHRWEWLVHQLPGIPLNARRRCTRCGKAYLDCLEAK